MGSYVEHLEARRVGDRLDELLGVVGRGRESLILGVAQAFQEVLRTGVRRLGALLEQRVLRVYQPVLGEVVQDQPNYQARNSRDPDEGHEDPGLEAQRRRERLI